MIMKIKKTPLQARGRAYIMGNIKFREGNQLWGGHKPYEMEFRFAVIVSAEFAWNTPKTDRYAVKTGVFKADLQNLLQYRADFNKIERISAKTA